MDILTAPAMPAAISVQAETISVPLPLDATEVRTDVIASDTPQIQELSEQLDRAAAYMLKKGDRFTLERDRTSGGQVSMALGLLCGAAAVRMSFTPDLVPSLQAISTASITLGSIVTYTAKLNTSKYANVVVPDGYTLQCIIPKEDAGTIKATEPVAFIHPRATYSPVPAESQRPGKKPEQIARPAPENKTTAIKHLQDALDVVAGTKIIQHVVIPGGVLRTADFPLMAKARYHQVVDGMKIPVTIDVPYDTTETAAVLNRKQALELREMLGAHPHPDLKKTVDALAERFPLMHMRLAETSEALKTLRKNDKGEYDASGVDHLFAPLMHQLMRQRLSGALDGAQRERGYEKVPMAITAPPREGDTSSADKPETIFGTDSRYTDRVVPLRWSVDASDPLQPCITTHDANYAPVDRKTLWQLAGGDTLLTDVNERLNERTFSDLQLVALALRLYQQKVRPDPKPEQATTDTAQVEDKPLTDHQPSEAGVAAEGTVSRGIVNRMTLRERIPALARKAAKLVLACAGIAATIQLSPAAADAYDTWGLPNPMRPESIIWEVHTYGGAHVGMNSLFSLKTYDTYNAATARWSNPLPATTPVKVPEFTDEASRYNVAAYTNNNLVPLPLLQYTNLAALHAEDTRGGHLPVTVLKADDGSMVAKVTEKNGRTYKLSYDLTVAVNSVHSTRPVKVVHDPTWEAFDSTPYLPAGPNQRGSSQARASRNLIYDTSVEVGNQIRSHHTAAGVVDAVYHGGRCNCNECATAGTLVQARAFPEDNVSLTTGYLVAEEVNRVTYLDGSRSHDFMSTSRGPVDLTPDKFDTSSARPQLATPDELRRQIAHKTGYASKNTSNVEVGGTGSRPPTFVLSPAEKRSLYTLSLGTAVLTLAAYEIATRRISRGLGAAREALPWMVNSLLIPEGSQSRIETMMSWLAFAPTDRPLPAYDLDRATPNVRLIPRDMLEMIAAGDIRSDHGLNPLDVLIMRHTARVLLNQH